MPQGDPMLEVARSIREQLAECDFGGTSKSFRRLRTEMSRLVSPAQAAMDLEMDEFNVRRRYRRGTTGNVKNARASSERLFAYACSIADRLHGVGSRNRYIEELAPIEVKVHIGPRRAHDLHNAGGVDAFVALKRDYIEAFKCVAGAIRIIEDILMGDDCVKSSAETMVRKWAARDNGTDVFALDHFSEALHSGLWRATALLTDKNMRKHRLIKRPTRKPNLSGEDELLVTECFESDRLAREFFREYYRLDALGQAIRDARRSGSRPYPKPSDRERSLTCQANAQWDVAKAMEDKSDGLDCRLKRMLPDNEWVVHEPSNNALTFCRHSACKGSRLRGRVCIRAIASVQRPGEGLCELQGKGNVSERRPR